MKQLEKRTTKPELIDLGPKYYSDQEYQDCLRRLGQIGRWLGGNRATLLALKSLTTPPQSILDVGCGGGLFAYHLARQFPSAVVKGIDINPHAISYAKQHDVNRKHPPQNLSFEIRSLEDELPKSYDIVIASLLCHHFSDSQMIEFIAQACNIAKKRVIINDLHRHCLAHALFRLASPIFFRNRLIQHDGLVSISKGFRHRELQEILNMAGIKSQNYSIEWRWAFRWLIAIDCGAP